MLSRLTISLLVLLALIIGPYFVVDSKGETSIPVFGPEKYIVKKPQMIVKAFSVQNPTRQFTLTVQNGKAKKEKVSSAVIQMNGVQVVGPNEFNKQVNLITKPIKLQQENEIKVEIRGDPGAWIVVTILGPASEASGIIGDSGGTLEVTDPNSPIHGAKIVIPEGAVEEGVTVEVTIDYEDQLPGQVEPGVVQASKVIVLKKTYQYDFLKPVQVVLPFSDNGLEEGDIPGVFYWDTYYNKYSAFGVKEIDTVNKMVTFTTVHFSKAVALAVKGLAQSLLNTDSGFRSDEDGFFHPNFGTYYMNGGNCLGMALYSHWYYDYKKATDGQGLYYKYRQGDQNHWEDDAVARELIGRSFSWVAQLWGILWKLEDFFLNDRATGLELITSMIITKSPQTFLIQFVNGGHAVLVYKWDSGKFYIYDNNFAGEEITVDWNPVTGFANYSKREAYGSSIMQYAYEGFSTVVNGVDFEELYAGAENGWSTSFYNSINIDSPSIGTDGFAAVSDPNNVTISGTVTGGVTYAKYIVYSINDDYGLDGQVVELKPDNSFSFSIPNLPLATNTIRIISTTIKEDATRNKPSGYAGYKEFKIKVQGNSFLTNAGFETGDFNGWNHETHTWQNTIPGSYSAEKSEIVTIGNDPIFTVLPLVYTGNYAVRINNSDNNYHISSVSQSVTVPNTTVPELRFYWAAVLEDPQHDAPHQPFVDVVVTDDTLGTGLYSKHHYTNDPDYSGWLSVFSNATNSWWRAIPWQVVFVDVNDEKGHSLTIQVTAADCGYGGHGGYVYIDGDE